MELVKSNFRKYKFNVLSLKPCARDSRQQYNKIRLPETATCTFDLYQWFAARIIGAAGVSRLSCFFRCPFPIASNIASNSSSFLTRLIMFARVSIYKQLVAKAKHKLGSSGRHDNTKRTNQNPRV